MCLADTVVACWPLTQEVAVEQDRILLLNGIFLNSVNSVTKVDKHLGKTLIAEVKDQVLFIDLHGLRFGCILTFAKGT